MFVRFTHANTGREIFITKVQVFSVYYSQAHKCTHILATAGAILPVAETVEEVTTKLQEVKEDDRQERHND